MKDIVEYIKGISPAEKGERIVLHRKMQNGDKAAKKRIIDSYFPITLRLSMDAAVKNGMPLRDLFSDAVIGLCDKLVKYNEDEFSTLTSYVLRGVNHAIQKHIRSFKYDFPISKTVFEAIPKVKEAKYRCSGIVDYELIAKISQITSLPIIGMGGIASAEDVVEFMLAGANAVAVGTAHFKDSIASKHIADALPQELEKLGIEDINELVGQVKFN